MNCYMGEYIAVTADITNFYYAWGDNRNTLVTTAFPGGRPDPDVFFDTQPDPGVRVTIDIKPGSFPNSINPGSQGVIPVAILTTSTAQGDPLDFDATTVDPLSVTFGPDGATEAHGRGHIEDVDGDGDLDLVLHFNTQETGIQCGDTSASLTGTTFSGFAISGSDSIVTVGCR